MTLHLLIIEDDAATADFLAEGLEQGGHRVEWAADGLTGLDRARSGEHDCIILDRLLPGMDGITLLQTLRNEGRAIAVIILSAIGSTDERVRGLRAGSDDYLVKPFAISELLARIEALRRREIRSSAVATSLACGNLTIDLLTSAVDRGGQTIALPPRAFRLLEYLMRNQHQVVTRKMILEEVWRYDFDPGTNVIDVHISNLRKAIDLKGMSPLLHTVRGVGYRLGSPS